MDITIQGMTKAGWEITPFYGHNKEIELYQVQCIENEGVNISGIVGDKRVDFIELEKDEAIMIAKSILHYFRIGNK